MYTFVTRSNKPFFRLIYFFIYFNQEKDITGFPFFLHFRFFTPCVQVVLINTGWLQTLWSSVLDIIILPFFQSVAKCCNGISVVLTREWETFAGICWINSNGNSHWTFGQMSGHLTPAVYVKGDHACPNAKPDECQLAAKDSDNADIWKFVMI